MTPASAPSPKPLAGIRVIDLTRVLAGPWATQLLGEMGADVIKVERPGAGDESRAFGPPFLADAAGDRRRGTAMFLAANRAKRSITLDISRPAGQEILRHLADGADVLVENYKVGALARYGLDQASLLARNPRLVYCSITGFGQSGPYAARGGYDPIIQAMCGMMSVTGLPADQPGGGPMKAGPSVVDIVTGLYAVIAVQGALLARAQDGRGQHIDLSLLDCGVALLAQQAMHFALAGTPPPPIGTQANGGAPGGGFRCADGYIMIAPGNDQGYARFCTAIGHPGLAADPRFDENAKRVRNRAELNAILDAILAGWTVARLQDCLLAHDVPASPVNDLAQVFADPQVRHRGIVAEVATAGAAVQAVMNPIHYSAARVRDGSFPPRLGEHTDEVLAGLGLDEAAIAALRRDGIV
jgi:crotonobetainyl-CoA:carnitine CoA-transferase CaiB-like acyl-CoA transferase